MNLAIPDFYDFLRGPGFAVSIIIFLSVSLYRTLCLIRATRKIQKISINTEKYIHRGSIPEQGNLLKRAVELLKIRIKNTIFGTNPVMGIISLVFHLLLFITPVFLSAHNIIADLTIGISLPAIPEQLTDIFALLIMALGGFFLARRIFIPRVRMISTVRDYLTLLLVMDPFMSAIIAYHHFFNYRVVIYAHMIIGEMAIIIIPFTGLIHMPFIIFSRFFIDSEYSIIPGNRSW